MSDEQEVTRIIGDDEFNPAVGTTRLVLVVDRTGSMQSRAPATVEGLNEFVTEQRTGPDRATLTVILFNTVSVVRPTVAVQDAALFVLAPQESRANRVATGIRRVTVEEAGGAVVYDPSGDTALYDAVRDAIATAEGLAQPEDRVLVLIQTDGGENASQRTTLDQLKTLMAEKTTTGRWTFTYMGVDIDAWTKETGVVRQNAMAYASMSPRQSWSAMNTATSGFRGQSATNTKNFYTIPDDETPDDPNVPATP